MDDIERRTNEHDKHYGIITGVQLGLMEFSYINPKFLSEAEPNIKDFFQTIEIQIEYKSYRELVAINPTHKKQITRQYKYIDRNRIPMQQSPTWSFKSRI